MRTNVDSIQPESALPLQSATKDIGKDDGLRPCRQPMGTYNQIRAYTAILSFPFNSPVRACFTHQLVTNAKQ